jgi:7-cyano-7-deazaguanine reductase
MDDNEMSAQAESLTQLGRETPQPFTPEQAILEPIPWVAGKHGVPHLSAPVIRLTCPEFTSLCPRTGQPDYAHIVLDYMPTASLVESKSLKLFMHSFRNHGAFHESTTMYIAGRLMDCLDPAWFRICAFWYPRGGIPIDVVWQSDMPPAGAHLLPLGVSPYKGR